MIKNTIEDSKIIIIFWDSKIILIFRNSKIIILKINWKGHYPQTFEWADNVQ